MRSEIDNFRTILVAAYIQITRRYFRERKKTFDVLSQLLAVLQRDRSHLNRFSHMLHIVTH